MSTRKEDWLAFAEVFDALRIWPKLMLILLMIFLWDVHEAYMAKVTIDSVGLNIYVNVVWAGVGALTGFYIKTGRKWL